MAVMAAVLFSSFAGRAEQLTPEQMADYAKVATCTVAGYTGAAVNEDFRLLMRVSPKAIVGFDYADVLSEGRDVRFVTADGAVLPHELDTWDPAGESTFWVKVPKLEQGMSFKMLYGKANDAGPAAVNIWDGYAGVWHLNEDANHAMADSGANAIHGSVVNPANATQTTGVAGRAYCHPQQDASGSTAYVNLPANATFNDLSGALTFSAWVRFDTGNSGQAVIWNNCGGNYGSGGVNGSDVVQPSNDGYLTVHDKAGRGSASLGYSLKDTLWHQIVITYDDTGRHVYFDGKYLPAFEGVTTYAPPTNYPWLLGTRSSGSAGSAQWVGGIDEFRIRTSCQSAAAVNAEYQMMTKGVGFLLCETETEATFFDRFAMRIDVTVTGLTGDQTLTNFPFAVRLSSATVEKWFPEDDMRVDGKDICFADANGRLLAFEVDTWNPSGESVYWVRVPELANGAVIRCYYGRKDAAFAGDGIGNVWYGYAGVWHVNETADGQVKITNASGMDIAATGGTNSVVSAGVFGNARGSSHGCTSEGPGGFETKASQAIDLGTQFTVSAWIYGYDCNGQQYIASRCSSDFTQAWCLQGSKRGGTFRDILFAPNCPRNNNKTFSSSTFVSSCVWHKYDLVVDGRTATFYLDGELYADPLTYSVDPQQVQPGSTPIGLAFGGAAGGGTSPLTAGMIFDEVRYSAGVRSADWIRAEYGASRLATTPLATYSRAQPNDIDAFKKSFLREVDLVVTGLTDNVALTNFPLSVLLSSKTVANFRPGEMRADGYDICFLSEEGTVMTFEVDTWNPSGESVYWVRVPELTNGLHICCLYGRSRPVLTAAEEKNPDVWRGYTGVWHVNETTGGQVALDDASPTDLNMTGGSLSTVLDVGVFGKARGYSSRGSIGISCGKVPPNAKLDLGSSFTMSGWVNFNANWQNWVFSASDRANGAGWKFYTDDRYQEQYCFSAGAENTAGVTVKQSFPVVGSGVGLGSWHKIDLLSEGRVQTLYVDGKFVGTVTSPFEPAIGDYGLSVGGSAVDGVYGLSCGAYFDEIRYSAGQRSAEWIRAEYRASGKGKVPLMTYSRARHTKPTGMAILLR